MYKNPTKSIFKKSFYVCQGGDSKQAACIENSAQFIGDFSDRLSWVFEWKR
jgi:hypothetical protein